MKILISAQDPGGANAVAPVGVALMSRGHKVSARVEGPARDILAARGVPIRDCDDPSLALLGTSAGDSIEKQITIRMSGRISTVAVLDFWSNYWQRFSSPGKQDFAYLPDRVCVMDDIARGEMVAAGFAPARLVVTGNPHFDHFADRITSEREDSRRILFISQPLRALSSLPGFGAGSFDEYTVLDDLIASLPGPLEVFIRLHPKEPADKYRSLLSDRVHIAPEKTLEESLSHAGLVVGMMSPVLMQAAAAGKKVLSYEPGLTGKDPLVSNRVGVTHRVDSKEELCAALETYENGSWPYAGHPLRDVWPAGATERVVAAALALTVKK